MITMHSMSLLLKDHKLNSCKLSYSIHIFMGLCRLVSAWEFQKFEITNLNLCPQFEPQFTVKLQLNALIRQSCNILNNI